MDQTGQSYASSLRLEASDDYDFSQSGCAVSHQLQEKVMFA